MVAQRSCFFVWITLGCQQAYEHGYAMGYQRFLWITLKFFVSHEYEYIVKG